jgi:hypothetical protein
MYETTPARGEILRVYNSGHRTGVIPPTRRIVLQDQEIEVHNTNNLYFNFHIYQKWQKEIPPENIIEEVFPRHFINRKFPELFAELSARRPNLYNKMIEIHEIQLSEESIRNKARAGEELSPEERDLLFRATLRPVQEEPESLLFYSKAFDTLYDIGKEIDPNYDTDFLCR